jgi:peptide/nickel transport system permease protein
MIGLRRALGAIASVLLGALVLLVILSGPSLLHDGPAGVSLDLRAPLSEIGRLLKSLSSGEFLTFHVGQTARTLTADFPAYLLHSLSLALTGGVATLVAGVTLGLLVSGTGATWAKEGLSFLGMVPDFLLAMFLQLLVIGVYQAIGLRLGRITSAGGAGPALLLPVLTMVLSAGVYLTRVVYEIGYRLRAANHTLFARSLGFSRRRLVVRHLLPGALHQLRPDLHKLSSIILASLFIIERVFNFPGLTALLFGFGFRQEFDWELARWVMISQVNVAFVALASLVGLYFLLYGLLRGLCWVAERRLA